MNSSLHFFFSQFFFLFPSFPHTFDLSGKIKKKTWGKLMTRALIHDRVRGRAIYAENGGKKDQRVGVYVSTVIGVQSQPTKCCDDFRISSLFSPF